MKTIYCHPDNYELLRSRMAPKHGDPRPWMFCGVPIRTSLMCPRTRVEWRPPKHAFVEYSESDHEWLRGLGFGHMHDTGEPVFYEVNPELFVMPLPRMSLWNPM